MHPTEAKTHGREFIMIPALDQEILVRGNGSIPFKSPENSPSTLGNLTGFRWGNSRSGLPTVAGRSTGNQDIRGTRSALSTVESLSAPVASHTRSIVSGLTQLLSLDPSPTRSCPPQQKNAVLTQTPQSPHPRTSTGSTGSSGPNVETQYNRCSGGSVAKSTGGRKPNPNDQYPIHGGRRPSVHAWQYPLFKEDSDEDEDSPIDPSKARDSTSRVGHLASSQRHTTATSTSPRLSQPLGRAPLSQRLQNVVSTHASSTAGVTATSSSRRAVASSDVPGNWNHSHIVAMERNPNLRLAADRTSGFQLRSEQVILVGTEPIAEGSYGIVWKGEFHSFERSLPWRPLIISVAIKVIHPRVVDHERLLKSLFREIIPLCGLEEHPNVIPIQGYLLRGDSAWIVTSWQAHGNAIDFLRENNRANRLSLILDVVSGLCHLHSRQPPIVHGDLKGDNVLIGADHTAKLADFGLARILEDTLAAAYTTSSTLRGCIYFLAPELLSGGMRTPESDVWALGGLILQIASGCLPFHGMRKRHILAALHAAQAPNLDLYEEFPHKSLLRPVIEGCWGIGSKDRWTVFEVASYLRRHIPSRKL